jgi:hypothetical protein
MNDYSEKLDSFAAMDDFCLLVIDGEFQFSFKVLTCLIQSIFRRAF